MVTETGRLTSREILDPLAHLHMLSTAGAEPGQNMEPGTPSGTSKRVTGPQILLFPHAY